MRAENRCYAQLQATTDVGRLALRGVPLEELFDFASTTLCKVLDARTVEISRVDDGEIATRILESEAPIILDDALAVRISGHRDVPWGFIAVHSTKKSDFAVEDSLFVVSIA